MAVNIVDGYIPSEVSTPYSAFESFFGLAGPPLIYRQIYYTIAPILAVMAHAVTLCGDKASGYVKICISEVKDRIITQQSIL